MKNVFLKFGLVNTTIAAIGIFFLIIIVSLVWRPDSPGESIRTIDGDGKGYYKYLPSIFINGNLGNQPADCRYLLETPNGVINRYNAGTALLMAPFFAATCIYYDIRGFSYDGYNPGFQKRANFAALFYFLLGLYAFSQVLRSFHFNSRTIAVTLALIVIGSNLLFYTVSAPAFSHVYSFFAISFLLLFSKRFLIDHKTKHLVLASVFLGLTLLIRPFNGLILFGLPFLAGGWSEFAEALKALVKRPFRLFLCVLLVVGIFSIQQMLWFLQTGNVVLYGYINEGFYFDKPQIIRILFSFRKGLFIYTPILLLGLFGLIALFKKNRYQFCSYLIFSAIYQSEQKPISCQYISGIDPKRPFIWIIFRYRFLSLSKKEPFKLIPMSLMQKDRANHRDLFYRNYPFHEHPLYHPPNGIAQKPFYAPFQICPICRA